VKVIDSKQPEGRRGCLSVLYKKNSYNRLSRLVAFFFSQAQVLQL